MLLIVNCGASVNCPSSPRVKDTVALRGTHSYEIKYKSENSIKLVIKVRVESSSGPYFEEEQTLILPPTDEETSVRNIYESFVVFTCYEEGDYTGKATTTISGDSSEVAEAICTFSVGPREAPVPSHSMPFQQTRQSRRQHLNLLNSQPGYVRLYNSFIGCVEARLLFGDNTIETYQVAANSFYPVDIRIRGGSISILEGFDCEVPPDWIARFYVRGDLFGRFLEIRKVGRENGFPNLVQTPFGDFNNEFSSALVKPGYRARAFTEFNYTGNELRLDKHPQEGRANYIPVSDGIMSFTYFPDDPDPRFKFNDQISSIFCEVDRD